MNILSNFSLCNYSAVFHRIDYIVIFSPTGERAVLQGNPFPVYFSEKQQGDFLLSHYDKLSQKRGFRGFLPDSLEKCQIYWQSGFGLDINSHSHTVESYLLHQHQSNYSSQAGQNQHSRIFFVSIKLENASCSCIVPVATLVRSEQ